MSESHERRAALLIDDDEAFRTRLAHALASRGWEVRTAHDAASALEAAVSFSPDLAVVDLRLPGVGGLEIVKRLRALDDTICILMLTGYGSIATALAATKLGADHYLSKPADADQIIQAYERAIGPEANGASAQPVMDVDLEDAGQTHVPSLARVEWEHIQRVLADCDGNISQAAKLLGLHRRSLQRKLSKYPPQV